MDIVLKTGNTINYIKNEGVVYILGPNQSGKTYILNFLKEGFLGKKEEMQVNNLKVHKEDYNVFYYDDTTDFTTEFKFAKNNVFRELIYKDILENINEARILKEVNILFDKIDQRVNSFLEINMNKNQEEKVKFEIEIQDINEIIDRFTNIYIDNYFIKDSNIPRSTKRKLIYNLLLLELRRKKTKNNIVIIDNFDIYLDLDNTKKIIKKLTTYHQKNPNTFFILSSSNNIYELINDKSSIYRVNNNKLTHINDIDKIITKAIYMSNSNLDFNDILYQDEIAKRKKEVSLFHNNEIGKLYISNGLNDNNLITNYCHDKFYNQFYKELINLLYSKSDWQIE